MVEKIIVSIAPAVVDYLDELVFTLYKAEYFSYIETAEKYVADIYDAIPIAIKNQKHKQTPKELIAYGTFYVSYKATKRTTWYVFFSRKGNRCLVKYVTNNHVADAAFLQHF